MTSPPELRISSLRLVTSSQPGSPHGYGSPSPARRSSFISDAPGFGRASRVGAKLESRRRDVATSMMDDVGYSVCCFLWFGCAKLRCHRRRRLNCIGRIGSEADQQLQYCKER